MMEIVTWKQLRLHGKPCVLINTAGYWDGLLAFLDRAVEAGFLKAENRLLLEVARSADEAVEKVGSSLGVRGL
jgi:predicted Rossmann-fold nucleotide-binding protein